jgi:ribosomal protein L37AE/L43A
MTLFSKPDGSIVERTTTYESAACRFCGAHRLNTKRHHSGIWCDECEHRQSDGSYLRVEPFGDANR